MSKSTEAQQDVLKQLFERGYARVEDLNGNYSDQTARAVLRELEQDDWVIRRSERAQQWFIGRTLVNMMWQNSTPVAIPQEALELYDDEEVLNGDEQ
jgi:hypothetical protein